MLTGLWVLFSFSFLVALTGALVPGPLMTYTIIKSLQPDKRGYLTGLFVITGHAVLESIIILLLLFGLSRFLSGKLAFRIIGVLGGSFLLSMGIHLFINVIQGKVSDPFEKQAADTPETQTNIAAPPIKPANPIFAGFLVSMSNPYWWIWWATVGFSFMLQYKIGFSNWKALLSFFLGHEAGDLGVYLGISGLVFFGKQYININIYRGVLITCALVMSGFGVFLGISPFL
jgi:threonine/homoserine/homoserine lactone efflux protein